MKTSWFKGRSLKAACAAVGAVVFGSVFAGDVMENGVRTLTDGASVTVTGEAGLGAGVTNVIVDCSTLTYNLAADLKGATNISYLLRNEGCLAVTPAARQLTLAGARLIKPSIGGTFAKSGPGALCFNSACGAVTVPTRFVVREGMVRVMSDFFGGHSAVTTNFVIDVREGATWHGGTGHGAVGPVELTGATWRSENASPYAGIWADTSFKAGITAHASSIPSKMYATSWFILCQPTKEQTTESNCVFTVEKGAELYVYADMKNGSDVKATVVKRGEGTLYLMGRGYWTGGTRLEAGKVVLGNADALGSSVVTVAGDVEMAVAPGLTVTCPEIKGEGSVTVSGKGGISFPKVASTVTGASDKAADPYSPVENGILRLTAMSQVVNVPSGETVTVTDVIETFAGLASVCDLRKTGSGTLVLGKGLKGKYRKLTVEAGTIEFVDETSFGAGGVSDVGGVVVSSGTIRPTSNYSQSSVRFTLTGSCGLDVPEGIVFTAYSNFFYTANATVTKTGAGKWVLASTFDSSRAKVSGTKWIIDEGTLAMNGGSVFAGHAAVWPGMLEIHENGELYCTAVDAHNPLGPVILRGGTIRAPIAQFSANAFRTEGAIQWGGYAFNGGLVVKASSKPSRVIARTCFTGHESFLPVFDIEEGAVLEMETALRRGATYPGGVYTYADGNLVKAGKGTLRLLRPLSIKGLFDIRDGTVELAEGGYVDPSARVRVLTDAKFLLNDGTRLVSSGESVPGIIGAAAVWVDATRLAAADGATLTTIANLGTAGGSFKKFPVAVTDGIIPNAPKFVAKGIGDKASIGFDGSMALALDDYVNTGTNCEVFVVGVWTNYYGAGGKGKWGGVVSLGSVTSTGREDQYTMGVISCYFNSDNNATAMSNITAMFGMTKAGDDNSRVSCSLSPTLKNNEPFVLRIQRGDASGNAELWMSDAASKSGTKPFPYQPQSCKIDRVAIGTRLMKGGCATTYASTSTSTRNLIGQIGEVLVFSKALTADERAQVNDYLRRKWIGTSAEQSAAMKQALEAVVNVETPDGARAAFVSGFSGLDPQNVVKTGAGEVTFGGGTATAAQSVSVNAGAIRLQTAALPSRVSVWVDADDASTCLCDADGSVTNLVNKGSCGGAFVQAISRSQTPHFPKRTENVLNGRPTLTFDGESALMTDAYTNKVASRRFSMYAVWRRNQWRLHPGASNGGGYGKWACVCTFVPNGGIQDEAEPGVFHVDETDSLSGYADLGKRASDGFAMPATGTPTLFVAHSTTNGYFISFETNQTSVTKVPRTVKKEIIDCEPMNAERIVLGARTHGGKVHYYGKDHTSNRCWYGDLAELIVTTEPLSFDEEIQLLDYLRKKWFNKGSGSATPPVWLSGTPAAPQFGNQTTLALADGTTLVQAADELPLGAFEAEGVTTWERVWDGTEAAYPFFSVAGSVTLGSVRLRLAKTPVRARILTYGKTTTQPAWSGVRPSGRPFNVNVLDESNAYWLGRSGTLIILR